MGEDQINRLFEEFREKRKKLGAEIDKQLKPIVLRHFNSFLERELNPALPNGINLPPSEICYYENEGFNIWTANRYRSDEDNDYQMPVGFFSGPLECEGLLADKIRQYSERTPWVSRVTINVSLSR